MFWKLGIHKRNTAQRIEPVSDRKWFKSAAWGFLSAQDASGSETRDRVWGQGSLGELESSFFPHYCFGDHSLV